MKKILLYYTDRYLDEKSHDLLLCAASLYSSLPQDSFQIISEHGKKPYFGNYPDIHFSISHSENIWLCAFAEDEVGVDVQVMSHDRPWTKLAERFFSTNESALVRNADSPSATFSRIWSRKEAVVKLFGVGINGLFTSFCSLGDTVQFMEKNAVVQDFALDTRESHSAAIAYSDDFELEIHKLI